MWAPFYASNCLSQREIRCMQIKRGAAALTSRPIPAHELSVKLLDYFTSLSQEQKARLSHFTREVRNYRM